MTDWYSTIFPPRQRTPEPDANSGSTIGNMVGRELAVEDSRRRTFVHPASRLRDGPSTLTEQDFAQGDAMVAFQREAGPDLARLGRRMQYRPRFPDDGDYQSGFPFPGQTGEAPPAPAPRAARATGVPLSYIGALTGHESGDDPDAKAPTSTATGHGQFIDSTWLRMMREHGSRYGLDVSQISDEELLELRRDPQWSAIMIGEYAQENEPVLRRTLRREVSEGEVYLGHWLGPTTGAKLIRAVEQDRRREGGRQQIGRDAVGAAAFRANMPIFYTREARFRLEGPPDARYFVYLGGGRLRTVTEVYEAQTRAFRREVYLAQERSF